jgi:hypothetical protein
MVSLQYKSLVTKEIIDYYLSIIKDEKEKKALMSTVSKFDIRIATESVIDDEYEEFYYYKIWIWQRGTKKRAHIKLYNRLELLKKEEGESKTTILLPSLAQILYRIRFYADVQEDYEEYCEKSYRDPSDETSRTSHPRHLKSAERFKKFITKEEVKSIPFLPHENEKTGYTEEEEEYDDEERKLSLDLNNKYILTQILGYSIIFLNDKKEYDKLADIQDTLIYYTKIAKNYGYDKRFPFFIIASLTSGSRSAGRGSPTPSRLSLVTSIDNSSSESFSVPLGLIGSTM